MQCAADVAQALRELHSAGRGHGQVNAQSVLITGRGYSLRSPQNPPAAADQSRDAVALGALIFEILTGARPAPGMPPPAVPRVAAPRSDPDAIRASALRIAARCLAGPGDGSQAIGKAAVELRLLAMLAKQNQRPSRAVVSGAAPPRVLAIAKPIEPATEPAAVDTAKRDAAEPAEPSFIEAIEAADPAAVLTAKVRLEQMESAEPAATEPSATDSVEPDAVEPVEPPAMPAAEVPFERIEPTVPADFLVRDAGPHKPLPDPRLPADSDDLDYPTCTRCGSADVHASKPCTGREKVAALALGIPLYRCHRCYYRWFQLFHLAIACRAQVHRPTY